MNALLLMPSTKVDIECDGSKRSIEIERDTWLAACQDLMQGVRGTILKACEQAAIDPAQIDTCVTMGPLLKINQVRDQLLGDLKTSTQQHSVDRTDVARGAAACLAGELPGRGDIAMPPRGITSQSIGIVIEDARRRRRILPIIPKGTSLPARTNRRLTVGKDHATMTLSLVESSGVDGNEWQSLGRHDFEVAGDADRKSNRARMIGFELDMNGVLAVRAQAPGAPGSKRLPSLPKSPLTEDDIAEWSAWIAELVRPSV